MRNKQQNSNFESNTSSRLRNIALWCLLVGQTVMFMNTAALNVALPDISQSLSASTGDQQWITATYNLVFASIMLVAGHFGDRFGYRLILSIGLVLLTSGGIVGALTPNVLVLIFARAMLGFGAGMFVPMGLSLIGQLFSGDERKRALTGWTIAGTLGAPLGPLVGGWLAELAGWRSIFVFDSFAFAVILVLSMLFIPAVNQSKNSNDRHGVSILQVILATVGTGILAAGTIQIQTSFASFLPWVMIISGIILITLFVKRDVNSSQPLSDMRLFQLPQFAASSIMLIVANFSVFGLMFVMPNYLEIVRGNNALIGGLLLMPVVGGALLGSFANRILVNWFGSLRAGLFSLAIMASGTILMGLTLSLKSIVYLMMAMIITGLGMGLIQPIALAWGLDALQSDKRGAGSSLLSTLQQAGSVFGIGILGSVVSIIYRTHLNELMPNAQKSSFLSISLAHKNATRLTNDVASPLIAAANKSYNLAVSHTLWTSSLVVVFSAIIILVVVSRNNKIRKTKN